MPAKRFLDQQRFAEPAAAGRAAAAALREGLRSDERIAVDPAIRAGFPIRGFCALGAWIWPVRILAGTDELRGLYWLDAASGALRPIAVRP